MTSTTSDDRAAVALVIDRFFAAFVSGPDAVARAGMLRDLLLPAAIVVRTCGDEPQVLDVESFIAPRVSLLGSGTLADFREWAVHARVDRFGDIAQVWCGYAKSWRRDGVAMAGAGTKSLQLVRTEDGWRISAVAWDDEPA